MRRLNASARRAGTVAVLGPAIGPASYEVGPEFHQRFLAREAGYAGFFRPAPRAGHVMFDLHAFIVHRGEPDYGRLVSAIVL